jgi:hypothetical protein
MRLKTLFQLKYTNSAFRHRRNNALYTRRKQSLKDRLNLSKIKLRKLKNSKNKSKLNLIR